MLKHRNKNYWLNNPRKGEYYYSFDLGKPLQKLKATTLAASIKEVEQKINEL